MMQMEASEQMLLSPATTNEWPVNAVEFFWTVDFCHLSKFSFVFFKILHFHAKDERSNYCREVQNYLLTQIFP